MGCKALISGLSSSQLVQADRVIVIFFQHVIAQIDVIRVIIRVSVIVEDYLFVVIQRHFFVVFVLRIRLVGLHGPRLRPGQAFKRHLMPASGAGHRVVLQVVKTGRAVRANAFNAP